MSRVSTFNFAASDPTVRMRRRAVAVVRGNSNAFLFPLLGILLVLIFAIYEYRVYAGVQSDIALAQANLSTLQTEQQQLLAVRSGVNADFSGITTALPVLRNSGKAAADRVAAFAMARPNHRIWWNSIDSSTGQITGGAPALEDVSQFATALHETLKVKTAYSTLGTAVGRGVYVTYTITVSGDPVK